jgi:hypothetical protein
VGAAYCEKFLYANEITYEHMLRCYIDKILAGFSLNCVCQRAGTPVRFGLISWRVKWGWLCSLFGWGWGDTLRLYLISASYDCQTIKILKNSMIFYDHWPIGGIIW